MSTDEVRDMIGKVLDGEPPVSLDYETVLADGRRRQARRHLAIVAAAVFGVVAIAGGAVAISQANANRLNAPAGQVTGHPEAGCGGTGMRGGTPSQEELAESARLTEAFTKLDFPALPSGVSMSPAKPRFCVVVDGWQATIALLGPKGYRSLFIDVQPRRSQPAGECGVPGAVAVDCSLISVKDTAVLRKTITPALQPSAPVLVNLDGWRHDGTIVRILETGSDVLGGASPRIMSDDDLVKIATAPELKVNWTEPASSRPGATSEHRAGELTRLLGKVNVLRDGMGAEAMPNAAWGPMAFYPSQGVYKLNADLVDGMGKGNLFIVLSPPGGQSVADTCDGRNCEVVTLPDQRIGMLHRSQDGPIIRLQLNTTTKDGTEVLIMVSNQSAAAGRTSGPSRPEPPLNRDDLIRIASVPGLHW